MKKLLEVEVLKEEEAGTTIEVSGTGFNNRLRVDTRLLHEFDEECHCGKDGHALNSINCPKHGSISERNALIDELIDDVEKKKGDDDAYPIWNDTLDDLVAVLKSKKK